MGVMMDLGEVKKRLEGMADPEKVLFKQRKFGIVSNNALGVYQQDLKKLAREIGVNSPLALILFDSGIYEARILCCKLHDPAEITQDLMEKWAASFENWEICDSFCMGFFAKSQFALSKASEWSGRDSEYVKRAGFVIMASYGVAHKEAENQVFEGFLNLIERESSDERLYVKKAVNWALRNIGKRNEDLNRLAITKAKEIYKRDDKAARWVASNALRELEKPDLRFLDYPRSIYR